MSPHIALAGVRNYIHVTATEVRATWARTLTVPARPRHPSRTWTAVTGSGNACQQSCGRAPKDLLLSLTERVITSCVSDAYPRCSDDIYVKETSAHAHVVVSYATRYETCGKGRNISFSKAWAGVRSAGARSRSWSFRLQGSRRRSVSGIENYVF